MVIWPIPLALSCSRHCALRLWTVPLWSEHRLHGSAIFSHNGDSQVTSWKCLLPKNSFIHTSRKQQAVLSHWHIRIFAHMCLVSNNGSKTSGSYLSVQIPEQLTVQFFQYLTHRRRLMQPMKVPFNKIQSYITTCRSFCEWISVVFYECSGVIIVTIGADNVKVKVNRSHYSPGQTQRVPRGLGSQISRQSSLESGEVVSLTHRPPLPSGNIPGSHFR